MKKQIDELRKKLIIEKAIEYFETVGYDKTQVGKIAKDLNIGVGTIYKIFGSKEGLFTEYLEFLIIEAIRDFSTKIDLAKDPMEKLKLFTKLKFEFFSTKKHFIRDYFIQAPYLLNKTGELCNKKYKKIYEILETILVEFREKYAVNLKNSSQAAMLYDYITDSFIINWAENPDNENLNNKIDEVINVFLYGITYKR